VRVCVRIQYLSLHDDPLFVFPNGRNSGQEEGNIDFVLEKKFGEYKSDSDPHSIAKVVCNWLIDPDLMVRMSKCAKDAGRPNAAEDIVRNIGTSVLRWKELHPEEEKNIVRRLDRQASEVSC